MSAYQKFNAKVLNPGYKRLGKLNRNFFYLSTVVVICLLCLCFFVFADNMAAIVGQSSYWNFVLMPLHHLSVGNLVENLIFFFVISLFLERHFGTIKYFLLVVLSIPLSSLATFAFSFSLAWAGFSCVNYFLMALLLWALIFNFKGYFFGKVRWLFPIVILGLLSLLICWNGDYSAWPNVQISFGCFTNLYTNISHWASCVMGAIVGLFAQIYSTSRTKLKKGQEVEEFSESRKRKQAKKMKNSKVKSQSVVTMGSGKAVVSAITKRKTR